MTSPGGQFTTKPLLRSPQRGRQRGILPRGAQNKRLLPRMQKLSPLCTPPLSVTAPGLPVPRGVSGGGAALSSLCRRPFLRRHNESHFAAQSPERSFFFPLFLSPRKKKRLLAATQSQNLCRQIKPRQLTAQFSPRWGKINYTTSAKTKAPYTSAPAGCYPPCPLSPAPSRLLSPCPLPVSRRCKAGFS